MKNLYFKVYQNKDSLNGAFFIEEINKIRQMYGLSDYADFLECKEDNSIPVFEPIFMTKEEFDNLPEFEGF